MPNNPKSDNGTVQMERSTWPQWVKRLLRNYILSGTITLSILLTNNIFDCIFELIFQKYFPGLKFWFLKQNKNKNKKKGQAVNRQCWRVGWQIHYHANTMLTDLFELPMLHIINWQGRPLWRNRVTAKLICLHCDTGFHYLLQTAYTKS